MRIYIFLIALISALVVIIINKKHYLLLTNENGFVKTEPLDIYRPPESQAGLGIYLSSAADMIATDPASRRIGKNPLTGETFEEIPDSPLNASKNPELYILAHLSHLKAFKSISQKGGFSS